MLSHHPADRNCAIVLPVYNEESSLSQTLEKLKKIAEDIPHFSFEIICVNDGSKDKTAEILNSEKGITVMTHRVNRGYGAALKTGLEASRQDWVFIVDADGTYPLEDLKMLVEAIDGDTDMVVGDRRGVGISKNPIRRFARWILRKMVHVVTGVMVPDLNSGMRIFRKEIYAQFRHLLPVGFSFTSTLTVASLYSGYGVKYVPIHYNVRTGRSNIRPVSDFLGFAMLIIRLASYFEPLRFFLPFSFVVFMMSLVRGLRDVLVTNAIGSLSVILFSLAVQIFITGVIADVIVRRSYYIIKSSEEEKKQT